MDVTRFDWHQDALALGLTDSVQRTTRPALCRVNVTT